MGYTHYWKSRQRPNDEQWSRFCGYVRDIVGIASRHGIVVQLSREEPAKANIDHEHIFFNGGGSHGHEDFCLVRDTYEFAFCKTARKPYDAAVVATLIAAANVLPGFEWSSDGEVSDHERGIAIAKECGLKYQMHGPTPEPKETPPHTNDIGIAIRDALDLLDDIERFSWDADEVLCIGNADIGHIDVSDASNLFIDAGGACFRVRITREG